MKTNTISLVISYYIFGGIVDAEAFASNDDAVKAFIEKVNAVSVPRGSELITTLEEAYEWLGSNEESLKIGYSLQISDVALDDEQCDLLALAESLEKAVAADIYYDAADHDDQDAFDKITEAKNAMLESARLLRMCAHGTSHNEALNEIPTDYKIKEEGCRHIGYPEWVHNDEKCERCYSGQIVELSEPVKTFHTHTNVSNAKNDIQDES